MLDTTVPATTDNPTPARRLLLPSGKPAAQALWDIVAAIRAEAAAYSLDQPQTPHAIVWRVEPLARWVSRPARRERVGVATTPEGLAALMVAARHRPLWPIVVEHIGGDL